MSAITITPQAEDWHKSYPPPTARPIRHPLRWARNLLVQLGWSIPGTHIGLLAWVAIYYLAFETIHPVKQWWDTLFSTGTFHVLSVTDWDTWRHFLRNGGEAYLASLMILFFTFNPYTHKFRQIHSAGQVIGRCLLALLGMIVVAVPIGLLLHGMQHWFHTGVLAPAISAKPNFAVKLYSDQWTTKVAVIAAAFITRRLMYPVYAFAMEYFVERRVARNKRDHWWQPAPFRAMMRVMYGATGDSVNQAKIAQANRGRGVTALMVGGAIITLLLAGFGYYVLAHIA